MWASALLLYLCADLSEATGVTQLRHPRTYYTDGFVKARVFKHSLRVCNAYPLASAVDVYRGRDHLTVSGPMPYKGCKDFRSPLKAGDRLQFRTDGMSLGTFSVSDLPNNDAVLLLVLQRHDSESSAVSFQSHVFASTQEAQVAVINAYKGRVRSMAEIVQAEGESEDLRFNSVVAVHQGLYKVLLKDTRGEVEGEAQLVALKHQSYVVLRTGGADSEEGPAWPQELVVYPEEDPALLGAAVPRPQTLFVLLVSLASMVAAL